MESTLLSYEISTLAPIPTNGGPESEILDIIRQYLPAGDLPSEVILSNSLYQLGVASLAAIALQYKIDDSFSVFMTMEELLSGQTVGELVASVQARQASNGLVDHDAADVGR